MALIAPSYKKRSLIKWICACIVLSAIFLYDGYLSKYEWSMRHSFYKKHVLDNNGKPDEMMIWNRKWLPIGLGVIILLLGIKFYLVRNKKIVADETNLIIDGKINIPYDSMEKIDKTYFDSKGRFTLTYKGSDGKDIDHEISYRDYDDLRPILDHLVAKIS